LEHVNGINNDHSLENLCFLCPNCHSQTSTYCGKNVTGRESDKEKVRILRELKQKTQRDLIIKRGAYLNSIDCLIYGWVEKASKEWDVSYSQVRRWVKSHHPELKFYERLLNIVSMRL
jgi:hypothetical protein